MLFVLYAYCYDRAFAASIRRSASSASVAVAAYVLAPAAARWRTASATITAAQHETLSDSTIPAIGIVTRSSSAPRAALA